MSAKTITPMILSLGGNLSEVLGIFKAEVAFQIRAKQAIRGDTYREWLSQLVKNFLENAPDAPGQNRTVIHRFGLPSEGKVLPLINVRIGDRSEAFCLRLDDFRADGAINPPGLHITLDPQSEGPESDAPTHLSPVHRVYGIAAKLGDFLQQQSSQVDGFVRYGYPLDGGEPVVQVLDWP